MLNKRQIKEEIERRIEWRKELEHEKEHEACEATKKGEMEEYDFCIMMLDRITAEIETLQEVVELINNNLLPWE